MTDPTNPPPSPRTDAATRVAAMPAASPRPAERSEVGRLPAGLRQAVAAACGAVPGMTVADVALATMKPVPASGLAEIEVSVTGWSPSLHALDMEWVVNVHPILLEHDAWREDAPSDPRDRPLANLAKRLAPLVAAQARRARDGMRLGLSAPASTRTPFIDHLTIDRSSLALLLEANRGSVLGVRTDLAQRIEKLHAGAMDHRGGPELRGAMCFVVDEIGTSHLGLFAGIPPLPGARPASADPTAAPALVDDVVSLTATLPDTALSALVGRPVRDLAHFHPALDDRIVAGVRTLSGEMFVDLVPDRVRLGDLQPRSTT